MMEKGFLKGLLRRNKPGADRTSIAQAPTEAFDAERALAAKARAELATLIEQAKEARTENPYRAIGQMSGRWDIEEYSFSNFPSFMSALDAIDSKLRTFTGEKTQHPLWPERVHLFEQSNVAGALQHEIREEIRQSEDSIFKSRIVTERGIDDPYITKRQIVDMNRATVEQTDDTTWDAKTIAPLSLEQLTEKMEREGSGRYFLHAFPQISIETGHIANYYGGQQLGAFEQSRDRGAAINFTAEDGNRHANQFYLQMGRGIGGGVLFPAEVLLQNYSFINLPYFKDQVATSGEWRLHGPSENPNSPLHKIPLNLGICFFYKEDESLVRELIAKLPKDMRPNKIIFGEDYNVALRDFLSDRKKPVDIPHISRPLEIIDTMDGYAMFGTRTAKKLLKEVPAA